MTQNSIAQLKADLATANHILFDQGILDAFGHVSVRDPANPAQFYLSRNLAPALVQASDVLCFDSDANAIDPGEHKTYLERFIHSEIYKAHPHVQAVVHSHSVAVLPFGVVEGLQLRPICHMGSFISSSTPVFEISCCAGDASDMLIRSAALGRELAMSLGSDVLVLMRGHGITVVGESLRQAVFRSVYAERNARVQLDSLPLGKVRYLNDAEARNSAIANDGQAGRAWEFWALQAAERIAGLHRHGGAA